VPAAVPMSIRTEDDAAGGNRWTAVVVALPVGDPDVGTRIATLRAAVAEAMAEPTSQLAELLMPMVRNAPSALLEQMGSAAAQTDVQASNIPGPSIPLFIAGTLVERFYGFGPLPGPAMMLVLVSYDGTCTLGIHYDTAAISDPERFERCVREGFDEVVGSFTDASGTDGSATG